MLSIFGEALQSGDIVNVVARGMDNCFLDSNEAGNVYCQQSNGGNYQKWKNIHYKVNSFFLENVATGLRLDNAEQSSKIYTSIFRDEGANTKWEISSYGCLSNIRTQNSVNVNSKAGHYYPVVQGKCKTSYSGKSKIDVAHPENWALVINYFN